MSTRCKIAYQNAMGNYVSIYCHSDGYPGGVGAILQDYYATHEKINELFQGGNLSELGTTIGKKHAFTNRRWQPSLRGIGWADIATECTYYHRDRGDHEDHPDIIPDLPTLLRTNSNGDIEYIYVFEDGEWFYFTGPLFSENSRRLLDEVLDEIQDDICYRTGVYVVGQECYHDVLELRFR